MSFNNESYDFEDDGEWMRNVPEPMPASNDANEEFLFDSDDDIIAGAIDHEEDEEFQFDSDDDIVADAIDNNGEGGLSFGSDYYTISDAVANGEGGLSFGSNDETMAETVDDNGEGGLFFGSYDFINDNNGDEEFSFDSDDDAVAEAVNQHSTLQTSTHNDLVFQFGDDDDDDDDDDKYPAMQTSTPIKGCRNDLVLKFGDDDDDDDDQHPTRRTSTPTKRCRDDEVFEFGDDDDDDEDYLMQAIAESDALVDLFGIDGCKKDVGLPKRKRVKLSDQAGGRVLPEPIASTSGTSNTRVGPLFEIVTSQSCAPTRCEYLRRDQEITLLSIKHNLNRQDIVLGIDSELEKFYTTLMQPYLDRCSHSGDILSAKFEFEQLTSPIFIFTYRDNFDKSALAKQLYQLAQSKKGNFLDGSLKLRVAIIRTAGHMSGSGRWNKSGVVKSANERSQSKRSIVTIANDYIADNSCGFRSLAVAIFHLTKLRAAAIAHQQEEEEFGGDILEEIGTLTRITEQSFNNMKSLNKQWSLIRNSTTVLQRESAQRLQMFANIPYASPLSLANIRLVEAGLSNLSDIKIIVVSRENKQRIYPVTLDEVPARYVCLEYIPQCEEYPQGHYNAIINLPAYMELSKFCVRCWVGELRKERPHNCSGDLCKLCYDVHGEPSQPHDITCDGCHTNFSSTTCYNNHIANKRCSTLHNCVKCKVRHHRDSFHDCLTYKCPRCNETYRLSEHHCNLKSTEKAVLRQEDMRPRVIIAYDIESQLQQMQHKPVLLVSHRQCTHFKLNDEEREAAKEHLHSKREREIRARSLEVNAELNLDLYAPCGLCGEEERHWFLGKDDCSNVIGSFINYLMEESKRVDKVKGLILAYAHNSRGYDCHFILQELIRRGYKDLKLVMAGSKILKLTIGNIQFRDSLSLFQLPLKSLPKSFGLTNELKKGDFPHRFNTEDNIHQITPWPAIEFYEPERKSPKDAESIRKFVHDMTTSGTMFDFDKELLEYCKVDVRILLQSLLKFRDTFINITEIDPMTRCFTLASVALENYRCSFYDDQEAPIGITPPTYKEAKNHSAIGDAYMDWIQSTHEDQTFSREQRIGCKWVDGVILMAKEVFEYNGCFFHGCPKCYPDRSSTYKSIPAPGDKTMGEKLSAWNDKVEYLKKLGFSVNVKWACELTEERRSDRNLHKYIKRREAYHSKVKFLGHIKPRDALFGGRTNNIKFWEGVDGVESRIRYLDFTSLYPYVMTKYSYPLGHPKVVTQNFDLRMTFTGLSKCKVLPPKRLRFGVLPVRLSPPGEFNPFLEPSEIIQHLDNQNSKGSERLVFPLCYTCGRIAHKESCDHSDEDRCIIGTWTTPELRFAISCGYKIIEVYEELKYDDIQTGLFTGYIKLWMKEKQEASGWPSQCDSEEKKLEYIRLYKQHEGINLEFSKIEFNPGRRFIAKLMLNSLWGKFAQRTNMCQTKIITDSNEYFQIITDPSKQITADELINDTTILVSWKYIDDDFADPGNTNVIMASFVTTYARLELLTKLNQIESQRPGRVLYFDTDSIIFEEREGDEDIPTGDYLGQLTDEIIKDYGPDARCIEFVSGGPKNYALKIRLSDGSEKVIIKAKGITLNEETLEKITFSEMRRLVHSYIDTIEPQQAAIHVNQFQIRASMKNLCVNSWYFEKIYQVVSEKRRIIGNDTVAFGHVDEWPQL